MLALHDKGVGERQVPVQKYLFVGREFKNEVDDQLFGINIEHGKYKMLEIAQFVPPHVAVIEAVQRCLGSARARHSVGSFLSVRRGTCESIEYGWL